eukprot:11679588-Prorocentrum_lima.AAC.1
MATPQNPATGFAGTGIVHVVEAGTIRRNTISAGCWSSCHLGRNPQQADCGRCRRKRQGVSDFNSSFF